MNTILTDDERPKLPQKVFVDNAQHHGWGHTDDAVKTYGDAREAAVLAKLAAQEPVRDERAAFEAWWDGCTLTSKDDFWRGWQARAALAALQPAVAQVPDVDRQAFERRMLKFGWRNFTGEVRGEPPCWYYDNAELNYRWVGWREAMLAAAPQPPVVQVPQDIVALLDDVIDHAWNDGVLRKDKLMDDRTLSARQKLLDSIALYHGPQGIDLDGRRIAAEAENHACSIAVWMTRMDAESPAADDLGVSGWLQEAENRIKRRMLAAAPEAPAQAEQELKWCGSCGEGVTTFCRGKNADCPTIKKPAHPIPPQWREAMKAARDALIDVKHGLEGARIWGGMDWTYNPLHPFKYLPLRAKASAALAQLDALGGVE